MRPGSVGTRVARMERWTDAAERGGPGATPRSGTSGRWTSGAALLVALAALAGCDDIADQPVLEIEATGTVRGILFLDTNGDGRPDGSDEEVEGWPVRLEQPAGGVLASTETDTAGVFEFEGVPVGEATLTTDTTLLGDTLQLLGIAFDETFSVTSGGVGDLRPGLTFPTVDVSEVAGLPRDRPVFALGVALNDLSSVVEELHVVGDGPDEFLRITDVENPAVDAGDSVRVFGRTDEEAGVAFLEEGDAFVLGSADRDIEPEEVSTDMAAEADQGRLGAGLVEVRDADVVAKEDVEEDGVRATVDDGTGPVDILFRPFLNVDTADLDLEFTTVLRATGLLVPREVGDAVVWDILPRSTSDFRFETKESGDVSGILFLDLDGNGQFSTSVDDRVADWTLFLEDTLGARLGEEQVTDTAGAFEFERVPGGDVFLRTDSAQLGDTLEIFGIAFEQPIEVPSSQARSLRPGLTFPTIALPEVDELLPGRRIYTVGFALNALSDDVEELHLFDDESGEALRVLDVDNTTSIRAGDSVRVLGRTARVAGEILLENGDAFLLETDVIDLDAEEVTTAVAATADDGRLDAALVELAADTARVTEVTDLEEDGVRIVLDDGSGPLEVLLRPFLGIDAEEITADTAVFTRARGLLVAFEEGGAVMWELQPRSLADVEFEDVEEEGVGGAGPPGTSGRTGSRAPVGDPPFRGPPSSTVVTVPHPTSSATGG